VPHLARIQIFPIKSLDPVLVTSARVLNSGALEFDRQYAIVDASGKFINGKRTPIVHLLRTTFDTAIERVTLSFADRTASFHLSNDREALEAWLAEVFGQPVRLLENLSSGFPDDTEAPGPTVISTATLETVAGWFPAISLDDARLRFRANLEIGEVEPFWEDRLYGPAGSEVDFSVGTVTFAGTNPCQRCVVPTRDPVTGDVWPHFTPEFTHHRAATFPAWAERSRFNHFYRLAVNTHLAGRGGTIRVGDPVVLLAEA
jgi:uncharacterized protein YcbX